MFVKLAKFRIHPSRRPAPRVGPFAPANDNRPHLRDSGKGCARRPRLVCRWFTIEGTGRLGCRWEIEGSDGPGNSLGPQAGAALHKTVVEPSYEPGCRWGRARLTTNLAVGGPNVPFLQSAAVLRARHSPKPSDASGGRLQDAERELCLSPIRLADCNVG